MKKYIRQVKHMKRYGIIIAKSFYLAMLCYTGLPGGLPEGVILKKRLALEIILQGGLPGNQNTGWRPGNAVRQM